MENRAILFNQQLYHGLTNFSIDRGGVVTFVHLILLDKWVGILNGREIGI